MNEDGTVNDEKYDDLTRPVAAFLTFNSDEGWQEAINYSTKYVDETLENGQKFVHKKLFGEDPIFTEAPEPTNIIWENRHVRGVKYI